MIFIYARQLRTQLNISKIKLYFLFLFQKISPEKSASFLSKITFNWFTPIILKGFRRPLVQDDLWLLHQENKTENLLKDFNKNWLPKYEKLKHNINKDKKGKSQISIVGPIVQTYWIGFVAFSSIKIITCFLPLVSPMIMDLLISFINNDEPVWRGYFYASLMFFVPMIESVLNNYYEYGINVISMRIRACLISIIYKKV